MTIRIARNGCLFMPGHALRQRTFPQDLHNYCGNPQDIALRRATSRNRPPPPTETPIETQPKLLITKTYNLID